jgi:hypothetical protein
MASTPPTDFAVGRKVSFLAGPTRIPVTDAEVTGHDGQFVVTTDAAGKVRKIRPGAITA